MNTNTTLTSIDYAKLLAWISYYKYSIILGKTQIQKLLFIFYGLSLARTGEPPFRDDNPKAWPHGPVFPKVYKRYNGGVPENLIQSEKDAFLTNLDNLKIATEVVDSFADISAIKLSNWSHLPGSPWDTTVSNASTWNTQISDESIKEFFNENHQRWRVGL